MVYTSALTTNLNFVENGDNFQQDKSIKASAF
jgi:hypothetical protein